ncbi:MAG TPA: 3',5'-nucleoside bisphosphate phosphatase [Methylophilaceae bacterium]|nr:3',5'-nucleoside bisphosphate phosphatase [Methylophilaceae bacterium]HQR60191.1 3',5'-nucleoside bisphosphate phosphatase [Methylophilaceae bacterium]
MASPIDLHSHSVVSDGTLTPSELVEHAAARGVRVLALTDHDDVAGLEEAAEAAVRHGIALVNGVEISVTWNGRTVHVVGLKISPTHIPLLQGLATIRQGRYQRAEGMAASLEQAGIHGSLDGAHAYATCGIISRTHFARFLVQQGYAKDVSAVFKKYLVKGKPGYQEHRWAALEDAVGWITGSGGIAVLAHPGRYDLGRVNMLKLLAEFRELGGTGVEVVTGSHTPEQYHHFARLSHQFGLLASLGSDYHGPGQTYTDMGRLPDLPANCTPVWHDWPEMRLAA